MTHIFLIMCIGIMLTLFAIADIVYVNVSERKHKEYLASLPKPKIRVWSPQNDFLEHE